VCVCVLIKSRIFVRKSKPLTRSLQYNKNVQQDCRKKTEGKKEENFQHREGSLFFPSYKRKRKFAFEKIFCELKFSLFLRCEEYRKFENQRQRKEVHIVAVFMNCVFRKIPISISFLKSISSFAKNGLKDICYNIILFDIIRSIKTIDIYRYWLFASARSWRFPRPVVLANERRRRHWAERRTLRSR